MIVFSVVLSTEMESDVALFFTPDLTGVGTHTVAMKDLYARMLSKLRRTGLGISFRTVESPLQCSPIVRSLR